MMHQNTFNTFSLDGPEKRIYFLYHINVLFLSKILRKCLLLIFVQMCHIKMANICADNSKMDPVYVASKVLVFEMKLARLVVARSEQ